MKTYYVYMLRCFDGTFYIGATNDVERRFREHSYGENVDCYTHSRRPLRLMYVGEFGQIDDAIAFEKKLKDWSHGKKWAFAERAWNDLKSIARGLNKHEAPLSCRA
jgi:putative endonuclease